jgi:hypothetical protein
MKGWFFDALVILTITLLILGPTTRGLLDASTAGLTIVGLVVLLAVGRRIGSGLVRLAFRVALPIASAALFVLMNGQQALFSLIAPLAVLLFVLFGIYVMFRGSVPRL